MKLKFYKIREQAKLPVRAHKTDAGMDLFYCPNGNRGACMEENGDYWLSARSSNLLSTGLKTHIPEGYMLEIKNKSVGCRCLCC
jgi:dUTPase